MANLYRITFPTQAAATAMDVRNAIFSAQNTTAIAATSGQIIIYVGANIARRRRSEIINKTKWLFAGVKERNLLDKAPWNAQSLFTASVMDSGTAARRTASVFATVTYTEDDVMIGWGNWIAATGMTQDLRSAVYKLIHYGNRQLTVNL